MTIVALPLFKIELTYQVKHGRRWTAFEHLLLWAVSQDARSLADLHRGTNMPPRLVVEALVNLLKVGWIELTTLRRGPADAVLFTANRRGRAVLKQDELPYAFDLERRFAAFHVDRLTANILDDDHLQIRHLDQIERGKTLLLQPFHDKYDASPARFFDNLVLRPDDVFERHLNHRIISVAQYAMLDVVGQHVAGLPEDAPAQLMEVILRRMPPTHWTTTPRSEAAVASARPLTARDRFGYADISVDDLLLGGGAHRREIRRVLREAGSVVYVHSTFIGQVMEAFIPDLVAAAERDVDVVLLWGERRDASGEEPNQSEVKGRLAYSKIPPQWRERIRLARDPTGSHAKIILADSGPEKSFEAIVGSCNWFSADYTGLELSLRLREPRLGQEIAGFLADMSRSPSGVWGRDVTTLLKIKDRCRQAGVGRPAAASSGPKAMLVSEDEHYAAVRDVRNGAARMVAVGCDLFGPSAQTTIFEPLGMAASEDGTDVKVFYNRPTSTFADVIDDAIERLSGPTTRILHCPRLHGKFLAWDDETLIITSFNWLSASTGASQFSVRELGVLIRDANLVPALLKRIGAGTALPITPAAPSTPPTASQD